MPKSFSVVICCFAFLCVTSVQAQDRLLRDFFRDYCKLVPRAYSPDDPWTMGKILRTEVGHGGFFYNCDSEECKRNSPYINWHHQNTDPFVCRPILTDIEQQLAEVKRRVAWGSCYQCGQSNHKCGCAECASVGYVSSNDHSGDQEIIVEQTQEQQQIVQNASARGQGNVRVIQGTPVKVSRLTQEMALAKRRAARDAMAISNNTRSVVSPIQPVAPTADSTSVQMLIDTATAQQPTTAQPAIESQQNMESSYSSVLQTELQTELSTELPTSELKSEARITQLQTTDLQVNEQQTTDMQPTEFQMTELQTTEMHTTEMQTNELQAEVQTNLQTAEQYTEMPVAELSSNQASVVTNPVVIELVEPAEVNQAGDWYVDPNWTVDSSNQAFANSEMETSETQRDTSHITQFNPRQRSMPSRSSRKTAVARNHQPSGNVQTQSENTSRANARQSQPSRPARSARRPKAVHRLTQQGIRSTRSHNASSQRATQQASSTRLQAVPQQTVVETPVVEANSTIANLLIAARQSKQLNPPAIGANVPVTTTVERLLKEARETDQLIGEQPGAVARLLMSQQNNANGIWKDYEPPHARQAREEVGRKLFQR